MLQLRSSFANGANRLLYGGQWSSKVSIITGNKLCLSIDVIVPNQLYLRVELISNATELRMTKIYDTYNNLHQSELNLLTEVQLTTGLLASSLVQLIVYVSDDTVLRGIGVTNGSCSTAADNSQC